MCKYLLNFVYIFKIRFFSGNGLFPTIDTHSKLLIDNEMYDKIHIVHIKSTKNNTIMSLNDYRGVGLNIQSGVICFKN